MLEKKTSTQSCRYRRNSEINENIAPQSDNVLVFNFSGLSNVGICFHTHTHTLTPNAKQNVLYDYLLLNLAQLGLEFDTRDVELFIAVHTSGQVRIYCFGLRNINAEIMTKIIQFRQR